MERMLLHFSALETMENKEHNGQGLRQDGLPDVVCSFPCKKASQLSVRPFCGVDFPMAQAVWRQ